MRSLVLALLTACAARTVPPQQQVIGASGDPADVIELDELLDGIRLTTDPDAPRACDGEVPVGMVCGHVVYLAPPEGRRVDVYAALPVEAVDQLEGAGARVLARVYSGRTLQGAPR